MTVEQQLRYSKRPYSKIVWLEQSITYSTGRVQVAPVYNLISGVRAMLTARTGAHWTAATLRGGPIYTCLMVPSVHIVIHGISQERAVVRRCRNHALASCISPKRPNYCESASLLLKLPTQPDCMLCMEPRILMGNCCQSHMAPTSRDYKLSCFLEPTCLLLHFFLYEALVAHTFILTLITFTPTFKFPISLIIRHASL
ncbi:hypothetical protein BJV77DRAFT_669072 [Russula vinacea]|nr:hypothetical protein BJV77DRAFT_669072 [Russula vinacea]